MAIALSFDGTSLQSSSIITGSIQHENISQKRLNIQKFADKEGGNLIRPDFDVKIITIEGVVKGSSQSNLESSVDNLKKLLNGQEKNLDIEYAGGTRRYIATCSRMEFKRYHYTIDVIDFQAEFSISNPPLGKAIDTATLSDLANTNSYAATATGEHDGYADYGGTFRPKPIIKITFTSANGIRKVIFRNTDGIGFLSATQILNHKFYDGDILLIDTNEGTVQVNGTDVEFSLGIPSFSLSNNVYRLKIVGKAYNVDLKFIYYKLWL